MKNIWSLLAISLVGVIFLIFRVSYDSDKSEEGLRMTTWDAFGYYMYNPSIFIYHDVNHLEWVPEIDSTYQLTGGELYQASKQENGNYVNKYLGGVAIMQLPFFAGAHLYASLSDYPADGFSAPYQYAIAYGAIVYCLLGLLILRLVMLQYFRDRIVALAILFMALATNLIQYVAIDGGQSHAYIFPLYAFVLCFTMKWHQKPHWKWAAFIGFTIGLATICRPTELIMLFIPLLWNTHSEEAKNQKWGLVRGNLKHVYIAIFFGLVGVLPQLLYWKYTSGSFIYDVGSKWFFFNPWFRVLFGVDNGFFIYTPIALLFVLGFFFLKKYPFQRSVLVFCVLNIWIIMAWSDWRYGATFSTRAMVQSYPVFTLAMAALLTKAFEMKFWKYAALAFGIYMTGVNFFQITQYNALIINYRDMSWTYYGRIYLNPHPTPLDMSLLDNKDFIADESELKQVDRIVCKPGIFEVNTTTPDNAQLFTASLENKKGLWVKVTAKVRTRKGFESNYLKAFVGNTKSVKVRIHNPICKEGAWNEYAFYMRVPDQRETKWLTLVVEGHTPFEGEAKDVVFTVYQE